MKTTLPSAALVAAVVGITGLAASLIPSVLGLEEAVGLRLLYGLRGPLAPPENVIVVAVSEESAENLGLAESLDTNVELTGWPRRLHADLIDRLRTAGARVIAFDIHFARPQDPAEDSALADAIARAGNVILFEKLDREIDLPEDSALPFQIVTDTRLFPLDELARASIGTAPFPLPEIPRLTSRYWRFATQANDAASLSTVAYAAWAREAHDALLAAVAANDASIVGELDGLSLAQTISALRKHASADPASLKAALRDLRAQDAAPDTVDMAAALVDLYLGPDSAFLNFYGEPRTISTVPADQILSQGPDRNLAWQDAIVFVGFSARTQPDQDDDFLSVYSENTALNLSGVEIAATATANLIDGRTIVPVSILGQLVLAVVLAVLFGAALLFRSVTVTILGLAAVSLCYLYLASHQFNVASIWWPIVVPGFIQLPVALLLGLTLRYAGAEKRRAAISLGAGRYIPKELVRQIAEDPSRATRSSERVFGTCMATDLEDYTAYSERLPLAELEKSLNAYYEKLFSIVASHGGLVTDIVGDSMVAVWRDSNSHNQSNALAIAASLDIARELSFSTLDFPRTRVGMCTGEFMLGTVGASDHLEYRAVGDVVNSASRVQALNKLLGTSVLLTAETAAGCDAPMRRIGTFELPGKANALDVYELIGDRLAGNESLTEGFAEALAEFGEERWEAALKRFEAIADRGGDDGPTQFYIRHIRDHLQGRAPGPLTAVVRISRNIP